MPQVTVQPPEPPCSWALLRCPGEAHGASAQMFPCSFAPGNTSLPPSGAELLALGRAELTGAVLKQQLLLQLHPCAFPGMGVPSWDGCWEGCDRGEGKEPKVSAVGSQDVPQLPPGEWWVSVPRSWHSTDHINSPLWLRNATANSSLVTALGALPRLWWGGNGSQGSMRCP